MKTKKITLTEFIQKHYKLGYQEDYYGKNRKWYLRFDIRNISELKKVVSQYSNIRIVKSQYRYAPEIEAVFITLC